MAHPPKTSVEATVAATVAIIEHGGMEHLSVRAVARRLGLAPNALDYRFPERKILEAAVAAEGVRRINAVVKKTVARSEGEVAVRRACRSYLQFGRSHPAIFAMMMKEYPRVPESLAEREFPPGHDELACGSGTPARYLECQFRIAGIAARISRT